MQVLYEDNHLLVVEKPPNIPVQPDSSGDRDMQTQLKGYIKEKYGKPGNVYLGIVHRLDRPVGGVMVFARTSKAAARLGAQFLSGQAKKKYLAVVHGAPLQQDVLQDYLIKGRHNFTRTGTADEKGAKLARLSYTLLSRRQGLSLMEIMLETGRSHQIRVQFASRAMPLWGDVRYGDQKERGGIALFARELQLQHPTTGECLIFGAEVPGKFPWELFCTD
ncbi:MAG: RluA family pseudouridine synthase [Christensenellales bacterium]|jgi:23S rRNA pseudouridine1911/1915/1917 synthase